MTATNDPVQDSVFRSLRGAVLLLRHGHAGDGGGCKRFVGQTELPLSERGRQQMQVWKKRLAQIPVGAVVSSDLERARESAAILGGARNVDVQSYPELREIHLGEWEGRTFDEIRAEQPVAFEQRGADPAGFRPPGGESFADLQQRVMPVFGRLVAGKARNLILVAHAGVNRVILCHLLGMPLSHLFRLGQAAGALNILQRRSEEWRIEALNLQPEIRG